MDDYEIALGLLLIHQATMIRLWNVLIFEVCVFVTFRAV